MTTARSDAVSAAYTARDFFYELGTNFAIFVAHREIGESRGIGGLGNVDIFGHATHRRF